MNALSLRVSRITSLKRSLLLATALSASSPGMALAADATISTNQTSPVSLDTIAPGGGTVTISTGVRINSTITGSSSRFDVINQGTIAPLSTTDSVRATLNGGGSFTNAAGATFTGQG